jgi:hypothetical protein
MAVPLKAWASDFSTSSSIVSRSGVVSPPGRDPQSAGTFRVVIGSRMRRRTAGQKGGDRASRPPACASPLTRNCPRPRRQEPARHLGPARAHVTGYHGPLPPRARANRTRRTGTRQRTARVGEGREWASPGALPQDGGSHTRLRHDAQRVVVLKEQLIGVVEAEGTRPVISKKSF